MASFANLRLPHHGLHERGDISSEKGAGERENTQPKSPGTGFRLT